MFPSNALKELWQWILAAAVVVLMVLMHMQQGIAAEAKPQDAAGARGVIERIQARMVGEGEAYSIR